MDTADRIGLLPGFDLMAGHNYWVTLVICVGLTPVMHQVVGLIGESRWVPITPDKQFLSYFPGDLFLGATTAGLLWLAQDLPDDERWYNSTLWHLAVLFVTLAVAAKMTYDEWKSGVYPTRAVKSPTKIYHNAVLLGGYGYVIVTTLVALFGWHLLFLVSGMVWFALVVNDSTLRPEQAKQKAQFAHRADWRLPWWSKS